MKIMALLELFPVFNHFSFNINDPAAPILVAASAIGGRTMAIPAKLPAHFPDKKVRL